MKLTSLFVFFVVVISIAKVSFGMQLMHNLFPWTLKNPSMSSVQEFGRVARARKEFEKDPLILHKACENDDIEKVKQLIVVPEKINTKDKDGETPLHKAIYQDIKLVQLLISAGAHLNACDNKGNTPLHHAVSDDTLKTFYQKTSDGEIKVVHHAYCTNASEKMRLLLDKGASVHAQNKDGETPLHLALMYSRDRLTIAPLLIDQGARIDIKNKEGYTPLHWLGDDKQKEDMFLCLRMALVHCKTPDHWHMPCDDWFTIKKQENKKFEEENQQLMNKFIRAGVTPHEARVLVLLGLGLKKLKEEGNLPTNGIPTLQHLCLTNIVTKKLAQNRVSLPNELKQKIKETQKTEEKRKLAYIKYVLMIRLPDAPDWTVRDTIRAKNNIKDSETIKTLKFIDNILQATSLKQALML